MLLSIVIPTKDRHRELQRTIQIMSSYEGDFEIIVQDNSHNKEEDIGVLNHVAYYWDNTERSVGENMDLAISRAKGKYVICIGDDDCISSHMLEFVSYMDINGIETLSYPLCFFLWEDTVEKTKLPQMWFNKEKACNIYLKRIDGYKLLKTVCKTLEFTLTKLPKVYHSIVRKDILDSIYSANKTYCPGPSPDIANAVAVTAFSKQNYYTNAMLSIAGNCASSAGGLGIRKKHVREVKDTPWLPKNIEEIWDPKIPFIWTAETIWLVSLISALRSNKMVELYNKINWYRFYCLFYMRHKELYSRLSNYDKKWKLYIPIFILIKVLNRLISKFKTKKIVVNEINTIESAAQYINETDQLIINE